MFFADSRPGRLRPGSSSSPTPARPSAAGWSGLAVAGCGLLAALLTPAGGPARAAGGPAGFSTVIVDAGHGGFDRGGIPGQRGITEKEATLDVALRLARVLRGQGLRVLLTRDTDDFISLPQRVSATYGREDAIFVSIHFNSAGREGAEGVETYYYRADSYGLAARLHQALVGGLETDDRRVRRRGFFVIRRAAVPAVLCECGFLTNTATEQQAESASYRQRIAQAIGAGIAAQRRGGDPANLGPQPLLVSGGGAGSRSYRSHRHAGHARYGRSRRGGGGGRRRGGGGGRGSRRGATTTHRHRRR